MHTNTRRALTCKVDSVLPLLAFHALQIDLELLALVASRDEFLLVFPDVVLPQCERRREVGATLLAPGLMEIATFYAICESCASHSRLKHTVHNALAQGWRISPPVRTGLFRVV